MNEFTQGVFGSDYELDAESFGALPENDIPADIPVVFEDRNKDSPKTLGNYRLSSAVLAAWVQAGESGPCDFPIAARAHGAVVGHYDMALALASYIGWT